MADAGATRAPFPKDPELFGDDDRIAWDTTRNTHILEDDDDSTWEWVASVGNWTEVVNPALLEQQQSQYMVEGVEDGESKIDRKRRRAEKIEADKEKKKQAKTDANAKTAIFVSNLPTDVTAQELQTAFSRYGLIAESIDSDQKRIKLYYDDDGNFKGEALIVYFRPESVQIAIDIADSSDFRRGGPGSLRVQEASDTFKVHQAAAKNEQQDTPKAPSQVQSKGIDGNAALPAKQRAKLAAEKKAEMMAKLTDWGDEDPSAALPVQSDTKRRVAIDNVFDEAYVKKFSPSIWEAQKSVIRATIEKKATPIGEIIETRVHDEGEILGVVTVVFRDSDAAAACAADFEGRKLGGRILETYLFDAPEYLDEMLDDNGDEKPLPKKKKTGTSDNPENSGDEDQRLESYSNFIEDEQA